jgi:ribosomal protein S12 methylthiotransferase accessory factor
VDDRKRKMGWVKGFNLKDGIECLIPAQLVYLGYKFRKNELFLKQPLNSTGTAGGFDRDRVLLNAIYEAVERDAFMNSYLGKINLPKIDLSAIKSKAIKDILERCQRYKLELKVLEATNDIGIPVYVTLLVDKTGLGPSFISSAKAGLNIKETIIGSITEAFLPRAQMRRIVIDKKSMEEAAKDSVIKRAINWLSPHTLVNLNFWLKQVENKVEIPRFTLNSSEELGKIKKILSRRGFNVFVADITLKIFAEINYKAYRVVIPGLQPLPLKESEEKYINKNRLRDVLLHYGRDRFAINPIPHPFL